MLAHKAVACFVTHCGWNSTLEGLSHGVPLVAMAQWVDQTTNAKFVADVWELGCGAAAEMGMGLLGDTRLRCVLRELMEGMRSGGMH